MKLILALLLFISSPSFAIQGGTEADPRSAITQSAISLGDLSSGSLTRSFCSGVIVSEHTIVTAAHCLAGKNPNQLVVQFGFNGLTTTLMRLGSEIHIPNEYQSYGDHLPDARDNFDIAVLRFEGDLPAGFVPAQMQAQELQASDNTGRFQIAGFGLPETGVLTLCETSLIDANFSRSEFELIATSTCSPATGDSGGPVYRQGANGTVLYGLHNWGWHNSDGTPSMSVEVKISFYAPWIESFSR